MVSALNVMVTTVYSENMTDSTIASVCDPALSDAVEHTDATSMAIAPC